MAWTVADIPSLDGKVAVVTGANAGLGFETARALAASGCHVVLGSRDPERGGQALEAIVSAGVGRTGEVAHLDLASLRSVETAAISILSGHRSIDILVNNAGVMAMPEGVTEDGFEMQLGVNHLGHWALTAQLMPGLLQSGDARVVTVTSTAHHFGRAVDPDNPHLRGNYTPWSAYGQSKLANYHFALGLQRQFEKAAVGCASLVAHPGLAHTDLQANTVRQGGTDASGRFWHWLARNTGMSPERGALPQLRAATDPEVRGGQMYAPRFVNAGAPVRRPILRRLGLSDAIDTLWAVSESETGLSIDLG